MFVCISPSLKCNLSCKYCYLQGPVCGENLKKCGTDEPRTADEWVESLRWLENKWGRITSIDIGGAEPFTYPHIVELIGKLPANSFIGLTTNALDIPEEFFSIPETRIRLMSIVLSLHLNKDGEAHQKFIENAKRLRTMRFSNINLNFVTYHEQTDKIEYAKNLSSELGIKLHLEPYIDYTDAEPHFGDYSGVWSALSIGDQMGITHSIRRELPSVCNKGKKYIWITANGDIHSCLGFVLDGKPNHGNIFERRLIDIPDSVECDIFCPCAQNWRDGNV